MPKVQLHNSVKPLEKATRKELLDSIQWYQARVDDKTTPNRIYLTAKNAIPVLKALYAEKIAK